MEKCPSCGTNDAYIGVSKIECLDHRCKYYSESWVKDYLRNQLNLAKESKEPNFNKLTNEEFEKEIDNALQSLNDFII